MGIRITPSILNADLAALASEIDRIPSADAVHLDVMDNRFVPNLTFGLPMVESIRRHTDQMLDIHLMIAEVDRWAPGYAEAGAESVTFHVEASDDPRGLARTLRSLGARASMALKPGTPIEPYLEILKEFDTLLVMSVEPGFGGQSFIPDVLDKARQVRRLVDSGELRLLVEIDGGINADTIEAAVKGATDKMKKVLTTTFDKMRTH